MPELSWECELSCLFEVGRRLTLSSFMNRLRSRSTSSLSTSKLVSLALLIPGSLTVRRGDDGIEQLGGPDGASSPAGVIQRGIIGLRVHGIDSDARYVD